MGLSDVPLWPAGRIGPELAWRGRAEPLAVGGHSLPNPLTYTAEAVPPDDEASCIARSLPIGPPAVAGMAALVPRDSRLTPGPRGTYLAWMAGGRAAPVSDQRYALLFFYGLERRALVDQTDLALVVEEVCRLLLTQPLSRMWQARLCRFVAFVASDAAAMASDDWLVGVLESLAPSRSPEIEAVLAGRLAAARQPLPPAQAARLVASLQSAAPVTDEQRALALFLHRYQETYGPGVLLPPLPSTASLAYDPASWTVNKRLAAAPRPPAAAPDRAALAAACAPLLALWEQCRADAGAAPVRAIPTAGAARRSGGTGQQHASREEAWDPAAALPAGPDVARVDLLGKVAVPLVEGSVGSPVVRWALFHGGERVATLRPPQTTETLQRLGYTPIDQQHGSVVLAALGAGEDAATQAPVREPVEGSQLEPAPTSGRSGPPSRPPTASAPAALAVLSQSEPDAEARALAARIVAEARTAVEGGTRT